jgi:uncharacterized protein DUF5666
MIGVLPRCMTVGVAVGVAAALLFACGGGSMSAGGVGEGGTGYAAGTVTGFGSLIVGGVEFDVSQAIYQIDEDPSAPRPAVAGEIGLGMQVGVASVAGVVTTATAAAELIAPVASIDTASGTLVALGQTVRIDAAPAASTVFEGVTGLDTIVPGMVLEIHGQRASDGTIEASRITLQPRGTTLARIAGTMRSLDSAAGTFTIGGATISYANAQVIPSGAVPENGARVVAYASNGVTGTSLAAHVLRIDTPVSGAATASVDGFVVASGATTLPGGAQFSVAGIPIDATAAQVSGGAAADLADGAVVRIQGSISGSVLRATAISILNTSRDATVQVTGPITDFVDANSRFRVHGAPVQLGSATAQVAAGLANGVAVSINGALGGGAVAPASLQLIAPGQSGFVPIVAGVVSGYAASAGRFALGPFTAIIAVNTATVYVNGAAADLADGRLLVASGTYDGAGQRLVAGKIEFLDNSASPPALHLSGPASVNATGSLTVDATAVAVGPQTQYLDNGVAVDPSTLVEGAFIEVSATATASGLLASQIQIEMPASGTVAIRGFITDFVSATRFDVAAQPVDASSAVIVNRGVSVSPQSGVFAEVQGVLRDGVLVATQITIDYGSGD